MTPDKMVDDALDAVLKASGSSLSNYTMQSSLDEMRKVMRKIMSAAYIAGSNDNFKAMKKMGGY